LDKKNNWLRRQAIVIILQQLREVVKGQTDETHLMQYLDIFRRALWPDGKLKPPELAANMIGRSNARRGARRMFAVLQNRRLNQHLVYTVFDEIMAALFPEAVFSPP
ncbi:5666_t:CDS:2, partial [Acaulospora colombiana]